MQNPKLARCPRRRWLACVWAIAISAAMALANANAAWAKAPDAPALGPPPGNHTVVDVATEAALQNAISNVQSNTTIRIAAGTYNLTNTLHITGGVSNIVLRGATDDRADVVLLGKGMANSNYGNVPHGIMVSNATDITIANLTVGDVWFHPITLQGSSGCERVRVFNVRMFDAGEQFLKSNPDGAGGGVDDGIVEYCVLEYTVIGPSDGYTNGVDVHGGKNWVIRHCLFNNIHVPVGAPTQYGPAVLMWNASRDSICESNTFINCDRAIAFGLVDKSGGGAGTFDHAGGIIRNNMIYMTAAITNADAQILVWDSPNTKVLNNSIYVAGSYPNAIEYRFAGTTGVVIQNNLTNKAIVARNGATGTETNNVTNASINLFVDAANGDLHLQANAAAAIDQGVIHADAADDWDGEARGNSPDLGADEYGGVPPNTPPIADAVTTGTQTVGSLIFLSGSGSSDPDSGPAALTYSWAQTAGPSVTLANAATDTASFTPTVAGNYEFELTVSDSADTDTATVSLTITDPALTIDGSTWTLVVTDVADLPLSSTRTLTNGGAGTLTVTVASSETWLTAAFDDGSGGNTLAASASGTVMVTLDSLVNLPSPPTATLTITGNDGVAHTLQITVAVSDQTNAGANVNARGAACGVGNATGIGPWIVWLLIPVMVVLRRRS